MAALDAEHKQVLAKLVCDHGAEVLSFLAAIHHDRDAAAEVFSQTCEDLLRTYSTFRGECSLRTWLYALAKNASRRHLESARAKVRVALSDAPELEAARRTTTATFMRTDSKDRFRALREVLSPDDRALLVLRVDRDLPWADIAEVLEAPSPALRKRFERIKATLRENATARGWLEK